MFFIIHIHLYPRHLPQFPQLHLHWLQLTPRTPEFRMHTMHALFHVIHIRQINIPLPIQSSPRHIPRFSVRVIQEALLHVRTVEALGDVEERGEVVAHL